MAKIAGIKLCQAYARQHGANFISAMPTNLYGPGDNFDLQTSDVLPALIRKMHEAKMQNRREVVILGTGTPRREFLHTHDLADALRFLLERRGGNCCRQKRRLPSVLSLATSTKRLRFPL